MAQISHVDKEIKLKVVYYGPALSGKTTNLIYIHQVLFPNQKVKLFSINTGDDRTLFFDLLPLELGVINGYNVKMQLFTVPGQVKYNQTRRTVLGKADGVVFVADSTRKMQDDNWESFENMRENLKANKLDFKTIPLVYQYNKQDLEDILPVEEMDGILNERSVPSFGAIAVTGVGVLQTLKAAIMAVLQAFNREFPDFSIAEIEDKIDRSFEAVLDTYQRKIRPSGTASGEAEEPPAAKPSATGTHSVKVLERRDDISQARLLEKAVETNIEMVELYNELNTLKNQMEQRNREFTILSQINQALTEKFDPENLPKLMFKSILLTFQTSYGSLLEFNRSAGRFSDSLLTGFNRDPLANIQLGGNESFALQVFNSLKPVCFNIFSYEDQNMPPKQRIALADELKRMKIMAFMSVPLHAGGTGYGLLNVYQMINESSVLKAYGNEDLLFLSRLATTMSLAFEKKLFVRKLMESTRDVDAKVEKATAQLREELKSVWLRNQDVQMKLNNLRVMLDPVMRMEIQRDARMRDFKTEISKPISSMLMASRIVEKVGSSNPDNIEKVVGVFREESSKLNRILDGLDSGSRQYFKSADFVDEVFPIREIIDELRNGFQPILRSRGLVWREHLPERNLFAKVDKEKVRFVLNQLVDNAIRFTPVGHIEISVQYDPVYNDRYMVVSCADTGQGIEREHLAHIFDRFYQRPAENESADHYGLGLFLCKEIIEHYGGKIWAKSEVGVSSTFYFELPVKIP
ncbi:MAG: hypothetical protein KA419_14870 [Acidobacteria bacterium]|nr:hypothetical protein [Acidobacteriota bacterium]